MRRQVYLIPNVITTFALACGLFVIFKVNMVEPGEGSYQVLFTSVILILLAAFADLLDGAVARIIRAESEFGFVFDSLADAVSFGVAPSVLLLKSLSLEQGTGLSFFAIVGAMIYSICGILRLVRFSVRTTQAKGNTQDEQPRRRILQAFRFQQQLLLQSRRISFSLPLMQGGGLIWQRLLQPLYSLVSGWF